MNQIGRSGLNEPPSGIESDWGNLGTRLRGAREATGFAQAEVAELLQVSRPTISLIEGGKVRIDSLALRYLATLYGKPLDYFFGGADQKGAIDELVLKK